MKLIKEYNKIEIDGSFLACPTTGEANENMMIRLNETGSFIFDLLTEETTTENIVEKVMAEYSGDRESIEKYINDFIGTLKEKGMVE